MRLDYGTLLSFDLFNLPFGFGIKSPRLKEISALQFNVYHSYLSVLDLNIDDYYSAISNENYDYFKEYSTDEKHLILKVKHEYESLSENERRNVIPIMIFSYDQRLIDKISIAISFFTNKNFKYSTDKNEFVCIEDDEIVATIPLEFYGQVADFILQRNGINKPKEEEKPKFKNKLAEELYYRSLKAEEKKVKENKINNDLELPNIISAVTAKHNSLNIINIWDITIYQLYDQFQRMQTNCAYDINAMAVSAWGDQEGKFDSALWYKNLYNKNKTN